MLRFPFKHRFFRTLRKFRVWLNAHFHKRAYQPLPANLAVGWFDDGVPADPVGGAMTSSDAFFVRNATKRNGELTVAANGGLLPVVGWLPNIPFYYLVLLRENGAAFYIASDRDMAEAAPFPAMRPVAVTTRTGGNAVCPGINQAMVGETGFISETALYRVHVARYARYDAWYGTAQAADRLSGDGEVGGSAAERGGQWRNLSGALSRGSEGAICVGQGGSVYLEPGMPTALIHAVIDFGANGGRAGFVWRISDSRNYILLSIDTTQAVLTLVRHGEQRTLQSAALPDPSAHGPAAVLVLDDGQSISCAVDGRQVLQENLPGQHLPRGTGVGIVIEAPNASPSILDFEAHPCKVDLLDPKYCDAPWSADGTVPVISDRFQAQADELQGHVSPNGSVWSRFMGHTRFRLDDGVCVVATREQPAMDRTAYGIDWPDPTFADLRTVTIPPGTTRGENHRARGGLIFFQDPDNYFIVNNWLDDSYSGGSISVFFYFDGFEDIYDAVWTNVDQRLMYGTENTLRVVCDGERFRAYLNDEPVIYRAFGDVYPHFPRLTINKVGLIANWEWGRDTGTRFRSFDGFASKRPEEGGPSR
jgi:hypothetical protein